MESPEERSDRIAQARELHRLRVRRIVDDPASGIIAWGGRDAADLEDLRRAIRDAGVDVGVAPVRPDSLYAPVPEPFALIGGDWPYSRATADGIAGNATHEAEAARISGQADRDAMIRWRLLRERELWEADARNPRVAVEIRIDTHLDRMAAIEANRATATTAATPGPRGIVSKAEVEAKRVELVANDEPAGERSIARALGVSRDAVRYALGKDRRRPRDQPI